MLGYNFEFEGYCILIVINGEEVLLLISEEVLDVIVFDWMFLNVLGIEVCC